MLDRVCCLNCHRAVGVATLQQHGAFSPVLPGLSGCLLHEPSLFTATLPGPTSVGLDCSHSPSLRLPAAGATGWWRSLPKPSVFAAALAGTSSDGPNCSSSLSLSLLLRHGRMGLLRAQNCPAPVLLHCGVRRLGLLTGRWC